HIVYAERAPRLRPSIQRPRRALRRKRLRLIVRWRSSARDRVAIRARARRAAWLATRDKPEFPRRTGRRPHLPRAAWSATTPQFLRLRASDNSDQTIRGGVRRLRACANPARPNSEAA